jgi:hypothetical protein
LIPFSACIHTIVLTNHASIYWSLHANSLHVVWQMWLGEFEMGRLETAFCSHMSGIFWRWMSSSQIPRNLDLVIRLSLLSSGKSYHSTDNQIETYHIGWSVIPKTCSRPIFIQ